MHSSHSRFRAPDRAMEDQIDSLLGRMTLEEKISLIGGARPDGGEDGNTVSCPRLGIPSFRMADASVGVHWWTDDSTTFPATIALAASFNPWLAADYAGGIARDCLSAGVHILLGPGVNLYRSPLCGRNFEYFGEDPCLSATMAVAYVKALQAQGVAATLKHYAVNYQEFDRNRVSSDLDERSLREVYLAAFEAAVREAGVGAIMTAYNRVNGLHCAENAFLIKRVLKGDWGFDGLVMSDWVSVYDALNSANAGLDLEMPFARWMNAEHLVPAVRNGRLSERVIDDKVRRLLRLALAFGWMDHEQRQEDPDRHGKNAAVALAVAREGMVLLKNDGILPLDLSKLAHLAVIGPSSDPAVCCGGGSGFNKGWRSISFLDGLKAAAPAGLRISHARGVDAQIGLDSYESSPFLHPEGGPGVRVSYFANGDLADPPLLVRREERINNLWKEKELIPGLGKTDFSLRYEADFWLDSAAVTDFYLHVWDGGARLWVDGEKIFDTWGREAFGDHCVDLPLAPGLHRLRLEFHNIRGWNACCLGFDPSGRKRRAYESALELAGQADVVVYCGGFDHRSEAEGADRSFAMPADAERLLIDLQARNPRHIVVLTAGGNLDMNAWHDRAPAIIHAWYPGQEGGTALAEIVGGAVNPSGRLPASFERHLEDRGSHACYHDSDGDLRVELSDGIFGGYRGFDASGVAPRYAFGHGLSYTSFSYERLELSATRLSPQGDGACLSVSFDLVNTGERAGAEVAQLYLGKIDGRIPRPVKALKAFTKCQLERGQRSRVVLSLKPRDFAWYDSDAGAWAIEPGPYRISVGASAADIRLVATLDILEPGEA